MQTLEDNIAEAVMGIAAANTANYQTQKDAAIERLTNLLNGWREKIKDEVREDLARIEREV
jgi:thioredoxin-like negative regulator of GroEL